MAKYRKKYAKRGRRRMRRMRRKGGRRRFKKARRSRVHHFKRTIRGQITVAPSTTVPTSIAWQFRLNTVSNFAEFTSLYDNYRINKVVVKFVPRSTNNAQGANERGNFYSCLDFNDDTAFTASTAVADILERSNVRITRSTSVHTRVFTPALSAAAYRAGATFAYSPKFKQWVDMTYPDCAHYGLKFVIANQDDLDMVYDYFITYYMSFKNVK